MPGRRTGRIAGGSRVPSTPVPATNSAPATSSGSPAPSPSNPSPSGTEPTIEPNSSGNVEALEAEEARLIEELDLINRQKRIAALRQQIDKERAELPIPSEAAEDTQTPPSQRSAPTRTQSEVDFDLPPPKRQNRPLPRTKEPPEYRGRSRAEYTDFLWACELNFRTNTQAYESDNDKVTFAIQYLKGSVQNEWRRQEATHGIGNASWTEFTDVLKEALGDPENRSQTTYETYFAVMQQPKQSVRDFAQRLELLEEDLNDIPEELRFRRLLSGFRKEIRDTISANPIAPKGRLALIAQASRVEESLRKGPPQTEFRQSTGFRSIASHQKPNTLREEAQRRAEAEGLREKRQKEGACYECGEIGHNAARCPNRKTSIASSKPRPPPQRSDQSGNGSTQ